jgi:FAD/FMN-containing dehydrogenase
MVPSTAQMGGAMLESSATQRLAGRLRGRVVEPGDADYDDARSVWNGMFDRRPALVARCAGTADVIAAIDFARSQKLELSVKGGGHGVAGRAVCDAGVVVDLSGMNDVRVDVRAGTATVGAGATWGAVDHETQAFGLAVTGGVDSRTGVAGLTLGGGIGYLARSFGLTIDSLLSAQVVLADGRTVTASADAHPDLFWALRGGGGQLGVVTSFEFRLHPVGPEVMTAQVFHPLESAADALAFYRDFVAGAPDAVACYALFVNVPPVEPFPVERHGTTALALVGCHSGSLEEGRAALGRIGAHGDPLFSAVSPMPYATLQRSFDAAAPDGARFYWKAHVLDSISDDVITELVDRVDPLPGPYSTVFFESLGGAISRVDPTATAFPHRGARFGFGISSGWADPADDDRAVAWTRSLFEAITPHSTGGVYVNYLDRDEGDRMDEAIGGNLVRLEEVRRVYDPDGVFGHRRPAPAGA